MSSVWVALLLALAGSSINGNGEFRWSSLLSGGSDATAAVAEVAAPPRLAAAPGAPAAGTGASATKGETVALAGNPCEGESSPLGLCGAGSGELAQLGLPVASKHLSTAALSASR